MSTQQQAETEVVTGQVAHVIDKGNGRWQVAVTPQGSQYTRNLWTKDGNLVQQMRSSVGQWFDFACGASHWVMPDGKPVRSLWINGISAAGGVQPQVHPPQSQQASAPPPVTVSYDEKEDRIHRQTAMKVVALMLPHMPVEERNAPGMIKVAEGMCLYFKLGPEVLRSADGESQIPPSGPGVSDGTPSGEWGPPPHSDADVPPDPEEPAW